jgi:membrane protease YdiL (CAAX protease family)
VNDEFTAAAPAGERPVEYAGFGRRLTAALLDSAVWIIGISFFNPFVLIGGDKQVALLVTLVVFSAWFNYFALCEWHWGQTIGKNALGIRVLPLHGGPLSWQEAALRNLLRLIDLPLALVGADYAIVRGSPRRQRLGDRAAKTIVVRERSPEAVAAAAIESGAEPVVPAPPPAGATAAEILGDATAALGQHPAAGSVMASSPHSPGSVPPPGVAPPIPPSPAFGPEAMTGIAARVTWTPLQAVAGLFAALIAALVLSIPIAIADPNIGTDDASVVANTLAQLIQTFALIGIPLAIAYRTSGRTSIRDALDRLGLRSFKPSAFGWMGVAVVAYLVIATVSYLIINPTQDDIASDFGPWPLQILMIAIAAPLSEELSFRGFFFGGLRARMPALAAALISGALFGLLHAPGGIGVVPQLFAFGTILALLYEKTGSIVPGMLLHILNNTLGLIAN